jgi:peptide/nickel transport system ATP-binding protein
MNTLPDDTILEIEHLKMYFPVTRGLLRRKYAEIKAVDDVSFKIARGETLGLVGESGCGKTTTGRCILRIYRPSGGKVLFKGKNIAGLSRGKIRPLRRKMQMIFQDPYGSLNPRQSAGNIIGEPLRIHHLVANKSEYKDRLAELFRIVGLNPNMAGRYPHEFSGGQKQRIGVARALACEPDFIV